MTASEPWIKICGVTCAEDLELLISSGATAVGLNLWSGSPRSVTPEKAMELTELARGRLDTVWVTVDMGLESLVSWVAKGNPDWVQLHGEQSSDYVDALGPKAFYAVGLQEDVHVEAALAAPGSWVLVDARDEVRKGGTGKLAPLELARRVSAERPTIMAGGLNPENVAGRIASVMPVGVDTASGVESSPGCKDPAKVRLFCERAREAFARVPR